MSTQSSSQKVRIFKPDPSLRNKAGKGEIPAEKIRQSQKAIDKNNVDFRPLALLFLERLDKALVYSKSNVDKDPEELVEKLAKPVMNLKANGALFGYPLVSDIASIMLRFIEARTVIDGHLLEIIQLYIDAQNAIIKKEIKDASDPIGQQIREELQNACSRYISKLND